MVDKFGASFADRNLVPLGRGPKTLADIIYEQYDHMKLHGYKGKVWKVGSHALDTFGYNEKLESYILNIRVELDCSLEPTEIKLIW